MIIWVIRILRMIFGWFGGSWGIVFISREEIGRAWEGFLGLFGVLRGPSGVFGDILDILGYY